MTVINKKMRYLLEGIIIYLFYYFFRLLNIQLASKIGGIILGFLSNLVKENNIAEQNLKMCLPNTTLSYRKEMILQTWKHFGSVIAELPHWQHMLRRKFLKRVKIINKENIPNKKSIIISGHLGNWELISKIATEYDMRLNLVYRPSNNPYVNNLINNLRQKDKIKLIPKGIIGVKKIIQALSENEIVGMMIDQKMNDGIKIPFFNKNAMTTALPANIVLKYKIPLIPLKIIKTKKLKYTATFYKPMIITKKDTKYSIMKRVNIMLEKWIREHPEQWFWFHNRWGSK